MSKDKYLKNTLGTNWMHSKVYLYMLTWNKVQEAFLIQSHGGQIELTDSNEIEILNDLIDKSETDIEKDILKNYISQYNK